MRRSCAPALAASFPSMVMSFDTPRACEPRAPTRRPGGNGNPDASEVTSERRCAVQARDAQRAGT